MYYEFENVGPPFAGDVFEPDRPEIQREFIVTVVDRFRRDLVDAPCTR